MDDDRCRCGRIIVQNSQGRRRKWCQVCSPPEMRHREVAPVIDLPVPTRDPSEPTLVAMSKVALEAAGVLDSWQACAALAVARLIDDGKHGASGPSGTVKSHRDAMTYAIQQSQDDADVIELIFREN
jgi:hypothetical protein